MPNKQVVELADQFTRLELHAARGGREVLRVFIGVINESQQSSLKGVVDEVRENVKYLLPSLPPYAPPFNNLNKILVLVEQGWAAGDSVDEIKTKIFELQANTADSTANISKISEYLSTNITKDSVVYTHTMSETVLGVLHKLHKNGKIKAVKVTESRPNNDGWETVRRLTEWGIPASITIDAAMPEVIEQTHVMFSGAEIINRDGSVIGKIGSFTAAKHCQNFKKPVFIVADSNKINSLNWDNFYLIPLKARDMGLKYSHPNLTIEGKLFDVIPSQLIKAYATEKGLIEAGDISQVESKLEESDWLINQLQKIENNNHK